MDSRVYSKNIAFSNSISLMQKKLASKLESPSYKDVFERVQEKSTERDSGLWSNKRLKKKKLQQRIEEIAHLKREMAQEINEEVAIKREIIMKQSAYGEDAPDLPITGVPAKYLLANLSVGSLNL